jgi:hypothetical protein
VPLGAGFSSVVGLPGWADLLSELTKETQDGLDYEALRRFTQDDYLQLAEEPVFGVRWIELVNRCGGEF